MQWHLLSVNWTGQAFTGEQMLALRDAAITFMRLGKKQATTDFRHESLEGRLTRGKKGRFGGIGGTFFHADCGLVSGERWTIDFLIPHSSKHIVIDEDSVVLMAQATRVPGKEELVLSTEVVRGGRDGTPPTVH